MSSARDDGGWFRRQKCGNIGAFGENRHPKLPGLPCHQQQRAFAPPPGSWPMTAGIEDYGRNTERPTWQHVDRLKKLTKMKLVLKGIETREDARLCKEHGVDGDRGVEPWRPRHRRSSAHHRKPTGGDRWRGRPDEDHG